MSDVRAMMRRAADARAAPLPSPLARYDNDGRIVCRVCTRVVGRDVALWTPHVASGPHAAAVAALRTQQQQQQQHQQQQQQQQQQKGQPPAPPNPAATPAGFYDAPAGGAAAAPPSARPVAPAPVAARASMPAPAASRALAAAPIAARVPPQATAPAHASGASSAPVAAAALPTGFYADREVDMRVHGLNPAAVAAAAADAEWAAFEEFASTVAADSAAAAVDEEARYSERAALAAAENALYQGRVDIARFVRDRLRVGGTGAPRAGDEAPGVAAGGAVEEELLGPVTFLSAATAGGAMDAGDVAVAYSARLAATGGARAAGDDDAAAAGPRVKRQRLAVGGGGTSDTDDSDGGGPDLLDWRRRSVA